MVPLPHAGSRLRKLKAVGFVIAVRSNWGWDLREDLEFTWFTEDIDIVVTSAQVGYRKPHPNIYRATLSGGRQPWSGRVHRRQPANRRPWAATARYPFQYFCPQTPRMFWRRTS